MNALGVLLQISSLLSVICPFPCRWRGFELVESGKVFFFFFFFFPLLDFLNKDVLMDMLTHIDGSLQHYHVSAWFNGPAGISPLFCPSPA